MLQWERGRQLKKYGSASFTYDAGGVRQSKTKDGVTTSYFTEGNRIHKEERSDGKTLIYAYDESGIASITYNGTLYYVQKNFQGDIVALVNQSGNVVAKYVYDAWGNGKVCNASGTENTSSSFIGNINPFRYRGYYYDVETGLYYLQTRYYDPQVGRFLNADSVDYIAPDLIGGLNLYAYCNNNPVYSPSYTASPQIKGIRATTSGKIHYSVVHQHHPYLSISSYTIPPITNHVFMAHYTTASSSLLPRGIINFSYTQTKQLNDSKTFYSFSDVGNDSINNGVGINLGNWLGADVYFSSNIGVGFDIQLTPWVTIGANVNLQDGISIIGGIINGNTTHEVSINADWGAIGFAVALVLIFSPVPGSRAIGGVVVATALGF